MNFLIPSFSVIDLIAAAPPISPGIRIFAVIVALSFSIVVCELVRRRLLLEKYAFVWLIVSGILIIIAVFPNFILGNLAKFLGIVDLTNALFLLAILGVGAFLLRITVHISQINQKNTRLTQEISILKEKIEDEDKINL